MEVNQILENDFCVQVEVKGAGIEDWCWMLFKHVGVIIRNGQSTRLNDPNGVPGLSRTTPELKVGIDGNLFRVKDLLMAGGVQWDGTLVRALFSEEDAEKILQINSLNPRTDDKRHCDLADKGKFSVKKAYGYLLASKMASSAVAESSGQAGVNNRARRRCWDLK
ncbi:Arf-GAP with GTPase, partial [Striga asiatica]